MKKNVKFILAFALALSIMLTVCGCKDEGQSGDGQLSSEALPQQTSPSSNQPEASAGGPKDEPGGDPESTGDPNVETAKEYTITIRENQVFIDGTEYKEAEDLKSFIESVNDDDIVFKLVEDHAIQATYEWVMGVFRELQIEVLTTTNS